MKTSAIAERFKDRFWMGDAEFADLKPEPRHRVEVIMEAMRNAADSHARVGAAVQAFGEAMGWPYKTARRWWDDILAEGWRGALDTRKTKRGESEIGKRHEFVAFWKSLCDHNHGSMLSAWDELKMLWSAEKFIPGYPEFNGHPPKDTRTGLPKSWSYENLRIYAPSKPERDLAHKGPKAFAAKMTTLRFSRVGMRCGQVYQFDDVWHNLKVFHGTSLVRPLELGANDVFSTRRILSGLTPRALDENNVHKGLTSRSMLNLTLAVLMDIGYCKDGVTLIVEHKTASLSEKVIQRLYDVSRGKIRVSMSGIADKPAMLGWWAGEGGGNPRMKGMLESLHGYYQRRMGLLPQQTGGNSRIDKPEALAAQEKYAEKLAKEFSIFTPEQIKAFYSLLRLEGMQWAQFSNLVHKFYTLIDSRRDHDLEGWEKAGLVRSQWRLNTKTNDWNDYGDLAVMEDVEFNAVKAVIDSNPKALLRPIRMSPIEVWDDGSKDLTRLPRWTMHQIMGDEGGRELKIRNGRFEFDDMDIDPDGLCYAGTVDDPTGHRVTLREGESYLAYVNPISAGTMYVCDASGRYMGASLRIERAPRVDREQVQAAIEESAKRINAQSGPWRVRNAGEAVRHQDSVQYNECLAAAAKALKAGDIVDDAALVVADKTPVTAGDRKAALQPAGGVEDDAEQFSSEFISGMFGKQEE